MLRPYTVAVYLPNVTAPIAISPSAPAIEAAMIWRFLRTANAGGSAPRASDASRASFAAVGPLIATAAMPPSRPDPIIHPNHPGTPAAFLYVNRTTYPVRP